MSVIVPAVSAVVGLVFGACLQYYFSRRLEAVRHLRELRSKAYGDFIGAVADSANAARKQDSSLQVGALGRAAEAKVRILLYGSAPVVNALAAFSVAQREVQFTNVAHHFVALVQAMRADALVRHEHIEDTAIMKSVFESPER